MRKLSILTVAFLLAIASCTKKAAPTTAKESSIDGASVYSNFCARCHGSDGTSGKAPNLAKTDLDKAGLIDIITKGHGHMPAFEEKLSTKEIGAVASFVAGLKK